MSEITDRECLKEQILQIREVIAAVENQTNGVPSIQPEELWGSMNSAENENKPMHPRLQQMLQGHVDVEQVKQGLKRLENDLADLDLGTHELYDPFKHELHGKKEDCWDDETHMEESESKEITNQSNPADIRDKNQRPLSAYGVKESKE